MVRSWMVMGLLVLCARSVHAQVTEAWEARYQPVGFETSTQARALAVDAGLGMVYVAGRVLYGTGNDESYLTLAYDGTTGTQLWKGYGPVAPAGYSHATAIAADGLGHVYVTGLNYLGPIGTIYSTEAFDAVTGGLLWTAAYFGPCFSSGRCFNVPSAIAADGSGTVYVTGTDNTGPGSPSEMATVAYDSTTGAQLWAALHLGPGGSSASAAALAVDGLGTVYITGSATIAYDAATGAQLWEAPGGGSALAVDGQGTVYITGSATIAYDAATGAQLWEAPGGGSALAVDGQGSVYITGSTTIAYDAATGAQLWEAPGGGAALAVDGQGSVYVTGSTTNAYDAATGAQRWEVLEPPAVGVGLAVDSLGTVYVTGTSNGTFTTVAYSPVPSIFSNITGPYGAGYAVDGSDYAPNQQAAAAQFTPAATYVATDIRVFASFFQGSGSPDPLFNASIFSDASGRPGVRISQTVTNLTAPPTPGAVVTATFSPTILLQADQPYWLVLTPADTSSSVTWYLGGSVPIPIAFTPDTTGTTGWATRTAALQFAVDGNLYP